MTLYFFPLSCARIAMVALEKTGVDYKVELVNLMAHSQKSPAYLAINPNGRVPALKIGNRVLIENVAIILYLDEIYPDAKLLPRKADALDSALVRADLSWCATTLHPLVRQIRATQHYTAGETGPVKAKGLETMGQQLVELDARFAKNSWWFGAEWSMVDAYLAWIISGYTSIGGDMTPYPDLAAYMERMAVQPAYHRMFEREGKLLSEAGIQLPPGVQR